MSQQNRKGGLLKDGTSRRAKTNRRQGMPRIIWVGIFICVAGAVVLFRQSGGDAPTGIGERRSVVTIGADSMVVAPPDAPRSGDVDIATSAQTLVPEAAEDGATTPPPVVQEKPKPEPVAAPTPQPAPTAPEDMVQPAAQGGWLVQVGSYGDATNADREATRLQAVGLDARVKVGNRADGSMIYRVRIGFFATRDVATTFVKQNKDQVPGAIAVHR